YWYETFALRTMPPQEVDRRFSVDGLENVDRAIAAGTGIVLALPHMGNWDAAGHWLCLKGYRLTAVAEELRPKSVFELFLRHRRGMAHGDRASHRDRTQRRHAPGRDNTDEGHRGRLRTIHLRGAHRLAHAPACLGRIGPAPPVRVAQACPYAWDAHGGVQVHVRQLAEHLRERGHEVMVIAP